MQNIKPEEIKKITPEEIKKIVEQVANVDDIGIKSRKGLLPFYRFIYFRLCYDYKRKIKNYSLELVGKAVNRINHGTVIYGLKQFDNDNLCEDPVYIKSIELITELLKTPPPEHYTIEKVKNHYRVKHIMLSEKYRSVINKLQNKIDLYESNSLVDKILTLESEELQDAEVKMDAFFKVVEYRRKLKDYDTLSKQQELRCNRYL